MEYIVTMTTHVPAGTPEEDVENIRAREALRARELADEGHLLRLWRPPLQPGEWRTVGLFAAADDTDLEKALASMPLRVWRTDEATPLGAHPNDQEAARARVGQGRPPTATVDTAGRVARPRTLAHPGRGGDADDPSVAPLSPMADSRGYGAVRPSQRPSDEPT